MAAHAQFTDWLDLKVQRHWYRLRSELEHEITSATDELRKDFDLSIHLNSATISTDEGRSVLRVPVSAGWRDQLEQTIAYLVVTTVEEDEPRVSAIAQGVTEALARWVEREVPIGLAPVFLYPEPEVRWPEPEVAAGSPTPDAPPAAEVAAAAAPTEH